MEMKKKNNQITEENYGGTQFKMKVKFDNGIFAMFKPMRVTREQQALPNQIYYAEYERHTSEIAAYHLDKLVNSSVSNGRTIFLIQFCFLQPFSF